MSQTSIEGLPSAPPPRRKAPWRTVAGIAAVVLATGLIALLLTRCAEAAGHRGPGGGGAAGGGRGGRPGITVGIAKATNGDIPIRLGALGTVTPVATVNVNARVSGTLVNV